MYLLLFLFEGSVFEGIDVWVFVKGWISVMFMRVEYVCLGVVSIG